MGMFDNFTSTTNSDNRFRFLPEEITDEITIGATCKHTFKLPFKYSSYIASGIAAYSQTGIVGFEIAITSSMVTEYDTYSVVTITLTPTETKQFKRNGLDSRCQLAFKDKSGNILIDKEYPIKICTSLIVNEVKDNDLGVHLVAQNVEGNENQVKVCMYDSTDTLLEETQPITIGGGTGGKYSAGEGINISDESIISVDYTKTAKLSDLSDYAKQNDLEAEKSARTASETALKTELTSTINTAVATEASERAAADDLKQDKLYSGTNIKTLNGDSLLGEGNLNVVTDLTDYYTKEETDEKLDELDFHPVHYTEDGKSLNELKTPGVYSLTNVQDEPSYTTKTGVLNVSELKDGLILQDYTSTTGRAVRLTDIFSDHNFYINGETASTNPVYLPAGGTYKLKGVLFDQVVISGDSDTYTTIILDGVYIKPTFAGRTDAAITNPNSATNLRVILNGDSDNYLFVNDTTTSGEISDKAALYSATNLTVGGTGYLMVYNDLGHGIKGKDTTFTGFPHIYANAYHDAFHGKSLKVCNGYYYVKNGNDAFSAGTDNTDGIMDIAGGEIVIESCKENAFQSKKSSGSGVIRVYGETKITLKSGFSSYDPFNAESGTTKIYDTVTINNEASANIPVIVKMSEEFGSARITDSSGNAITAVSGVFTIDKTPVTMKGDFSSYRVVASVSKPKITLSNVYYKNETADGLAFFEYTVNSGSVEFKLDDNSINYFYKQDGYCFKSAKHVGFNKANTEYYGDLFIQCPDGYGIYAPLGDTRLVNDGLRAVYNCKYGIYTNMLTLGDEYDPTSTGKPDLTKSKCTSNYTINCSEYDVGLVSRLDSEGSLLTGYVIMSANNYLDAMLGKVVNLTEGDVAKIEAVTAVVKLDKVEFTNTANLYIRDSDIDHDTAVEYTLPKDCDTKFPAIIQSQPWLHDMDSYTKAEANGLFVTLLAYQSKIAELDARIKALEEGKESTDPVVTGTDLTLSNVAVSGNDIDVGTKATFSENDLKL